MDSSLHGPDGRQQSSGRDSSPWARAAESPTWSCVPPRASVEWLSARHSFSTILRRVPLNSPDSFPCSLGIGAAGRGCGSRARPAGRALGGSCLSRQLSNSDACCVNSRLLGPATLNTVTANVGTTQACWTFQDERSLVRLATSTLRRHRRPRHGLATSKPCWAGPYLHLRSQRS